MKVQLKPRQGFPLKTSAFWKTRSASFSMNTSPMKSFGTIVSKSRSIEKDKTGQLSVEASSKKLYDMRSMGQLQDKRLRTALVPKNFEESSVGVEPSHSSCTKGLRGSKLHTKKQFRKNKFIEVENFVGAEPTEPELKASGGLVARYNKPNLMYNLNLFRKKYKRQYLSQKNSRESLKLKAGQSTYYAQKSKRHRKLLKTEQNQQYVKLRTFTQRFEE